MLKENVAQLLDKEMDRKDFLKIVGVGLIAATGIGQVIATLTKHTVPQQSAAASQAYGSSPYGGQRITRA